MDVVVAGGHGQVALRLERLLAATGHTARALIRNPDHATDVAAAGAEPVVLDLEAADDLTGAVRGADAVVFAAGAGPGSGPARKRTVDLGAAVKLIEAARATGVDRYVMVSSMGADRPEEGTGAMGPYLRAKAEADAALVAAGLAHTVVRPGRLTDEPGTGLVTLAEHVPRGSIPRDDVAAVLLAALTGRALVGRTVELVSGTTPVAEAIARA
ncbi:MAG TPA: SDR family oxidoreductase [Acidimicrobiales bacterium]